MDLGVATIAAAIGYLFGSLSFARIVVRLSGRDVDIGHWEVRLPTGEAFTSNIVSATSVRLALGPRYGCLTSLLDMAKVAVPVLVIRLWAPDQPYYLIAAAAGVVGHVLPAWYGFRGGHGETPLLGGMLVIDPVALVATTTLGFAVGFLVGHILAIRWGGLLLLVPWMWIATGDPWVVGYLFVALGLYFWASARDLAQYRGMIERGHAPTNEEIAAEIGMGRGLGRALDRYGVVPAVIRAVRGTKRPSS